MPEILRELVRSRAVIDVNHKDVLFNMIIPTVSGYQPGTVRPVVNIQELQLTAFDATVKAFCLTLLFGGPIRDFERWPSEVVVIDTNAMTRIRYYFDASYDDVVRLFRSKRDVTIAELEQTGAAFLGRRIMTRYTISAD